jgi:hypothetical protein
MTSDGMTPKGAKTAPTDDRIQDAASDLVDQAGRTADAHASRTMTQAGDTLHHVADAVRGAGSDLRGERPEFANVATTVADQVDRAASYLQQHDASEAMDAATDFARRQPVLVVGGALLAGLALGRFLRSAADSQAGLHNGSARSQRRAGTGAGMSYAYRNSYESDYASDYNAERTEQMLGSTSDFENRTSELEGTSSSASGGGSSPASSTRKRSAVTESRSSSTSSPGRSTSSVSDSSSAASSRGS